MECGVGCTTFLIITLVIALSLMLAGLLTTGWLDCNGTEYGLFEACTPDGSCDSYDGSEAARTAAKALILTGIAAAFICFIYSVVCLILMKTNCGPDCYGKDKWTTLAGILLVFGGAICIGGVVLFAAEVETPCDNQVTEYSPYVTGAGGAISIVSGFLLLPDSKRTGPEW